MTIDIFEPEVNKDCSFAVAVPAGKVVVPIQSYETRELLERGYKGWLNYATKSGITKSLPIEFLDKSGKCRILVNMVQRD